MTQIKLHYAVLLLYWVGRPFGAAVPIDQIQKRGPVDCFPVVPPDTPFYWWDCANAVLEINGKSPNSNNVPYVFGSDLGATHTNDVYSWTSGTCIIEMAAESSVNQVATWNSIKTAALRIVNHCVKGQNQLGGTYVPRRASDPLGSPSLHVWVFPVDSPEAGNSSSSEPSETKDLATCAAQHRASTPSLDSGCAWDSVTSVNVFSELGIGGST